MEPTRPLTLDSAAPSHGPYCPFTGAVRRPWAQRIASGALCLAIAAGFALHGLALLAGTIGAPLALGSGAVVAVAFGVACVEPRARAVGLLTAAGVSLWSGARSWGRGAPLGGEGLEGWIGAAMATLARADESVLQAVGTRCYSLVALVLGVTALAMLLADLAAAWRVADLPQRLWFARYHPVWRRAYTPSQSAHPFVGLLCVERDPMLAQKLVFLAIEPGSNALRFAGAPELGARAAMPFVPLAELAKPAVLWFERSTAYLRGALDPGGPAQLRLFLREPATAPEGRIPELCLAPVDDLPVADWFAADDTLFGKRHTRPPAQRLVGVLFDSRPATPADDGLPRFSTLLLVDGRPHVERPHPDLLGAPRYDPERERWQLMWRSDSDEPTPIELERGRDCVVFVRARGAQYYLLFVAFGGPGR